MLKMTGTRKEDQDASKVKLREVGVMMLPVSATVGSQFDLTHV